MVARALSPRSFRTFTHMRCVVVSASSSTKPKDSAPGTIRGDFAVNMGRNIIHGSDSQSETHNSRTGRGKRRQRETNHRGKARLKMGQPPKQQSRELTPFLCCLSLLFWRLSAHAFLRKSAEHEIKYWFAENEIANWSPSANVWLYE